MKNTKLEKKSLFKVIDDAEAIQISGSLSSLKIKCRFDPKPLFKCRFDPKLLSEKGVLTDVIPSTVA
ncbi:hypothetical protein [uncultured Nostoc sp.]|uniref:hypothetical protein n=1 Tax=uncultured Nostoc sp. TaxID=340711 RepID=UPI0035C97427